MSENDRIERIQNGMDKISDKLDKLLEVVSDIRANERLVEHRFTEHEQKHAELDDKIKALEKHAEDTFARKEVVQPLVNARNWVVKLIVGAVITALVGLVVYPAVKPTNVIHKKPEIQKTEGQ